MGEAGCNADVDAPRGIREVHERRYREMGTDRQDLGRQGRSVSELHLLCAGAAKGLVQALQPQFTASHQATVKLDFGAVGAMREKLLAGMPCDLISLSAPIIDELAAQGRVRPESRVVLGKVDTGIAVPAGAETPDIADAD